MLVMMRRPPTKMRTIGKAAIEQFDGVFLFPQNEMKIFKKKYVELRNHYRRKTR